jgi:hypothetical protein
MTHVLSDDTHFIDFDPEILNALDEDEKLAAGINKNLTLKINRIVYQKGKEIALELIDLINGTTKKIKKICFLSSDYRLLKFIGIPKIYYTIGTKSYYDLINVPPERLKELNQYQDDLKKNKPQKLIAYSTLSDLMNFISYTYNSTSKI